MHPSNNMYHNQNSVLTHFVVLSFERLQKKLHNAAFPLYFSHHNEDRTSKVPRKGGGVIHHGVGRGCAPVLGSFRPENSGIGIYFYWKIFVIGVYLQLEFSGIGVYCYAQDSGNGC